MSSLLSDWLMVLQQLEIKVYARLFPAACLFDWRNA